MTRIEKLQKQQIPQVAKIHKEFLTNGFVSTLPQNFLEKFYEVLDREKDIFTFVAIDGANVLGFVNATTDVRSIPILVVSRLWRQITKQVILNPPLLLKIFQLALYSSFTGKENSCEILSIALIPSARGYGLGWKLILEAKKEFKKRGYRKFRLSVRDSRKDANLFYKKIGLAKIKSTKFLGDTINFWQGEC